MSIVGPRPLAVIYLDYYNDEEKKRHTVLPGLTGLAQVNGRNVLNSTELRYCLIRWEMRIVHYLFRF